MPELQVQTIKEVIKMIPKLNLEDLTYIKSLMEKAIDKKLLSLEPSVKLKNMDITEKIMYLEYLTEPNETKEEELKNAIDFEEILKREGLTLDDLQD